MHDVLYVLAAFAAMALVTAALRALPFLAGKWLLRQAWVKPVNAVLPLAIMVILTLHAVLGNAAGRGAAWPALELGCVALALGLQWLVRNPLLSMAAATAAYVVLVNGAWALP
ncbi:MAG: AzlD domain-containing protein [Duodenibacillus sp.]|nr:AzlD domain-containing protein [Duodenibacillus sp.]